MTSEHHGHHPVASSVPSPSVPLRSSCDQCRLHKIKCKRRESQSACMTCTARGASCVTSPKAPRKQQMRRNREDDLQEIESRIGGMETLLAASGLFKEAPPNDVKVSPEQEKLSSRMLVLTADEGDGTMHFWGPSSGLALFSPRGLQWIAERTGMDDLQGFMADLAKPRAPDIAAKVLNLWSPMPFEKRAPLPPRQIADRYIRQFFGPHNRVSPLFDKATFLQLYEQQYSPKPPRGAAWYASLNVVFTLGSMVEDLGKDGSSPDSVLQDEPLPFSFAAYFRNACSVLLDLMFLSHSIRAVEALLGICFILETTLDVQSVYVVVAAAARIAHTIGLHKRLDGLSPAKMRERSNAFWVLYVVEKNITLRLGRPSVIDNCDIEIPFPVYGDYLGDQERKSGKPDVFYHQVTLARLEAKISTELFSGRPMHRPIPEKLALTAQLDKELQEWREDVNSDIRPGLPISCPPEHFSQVVMLHYLYYSCVIAIHRPPALGTMRPSAGFDMKRVEGQTHNRMYMSQQHCVNAARSTAQILNLIAKEDSKEGYFPQSFVLRLGKFYPLNAFLILFSNILHHPHDSTVKSDKSLMELISSFFANTADNGFGNPMELSRTVFDKLTTVTSIFLAKNEAENRGPKRGHEMFESEQLPSQHKVSHREAVAETPHETQSQHNFNLKASDSNPYFDVSQEPSYQAQNLPSSDVSDPMNALSQFGDANLPPAEFSQQPFPSLPYDFGTFNWDLANYVDFSGENYFEAP